MAGASQLAGGVGGVDTGGGGISPSSSASSSNKGGNNSLGGFSFGGYNDSPNYTPYIIGAVVLAVLWFMMKGKKR
ncbi:hypothetical protein [Marinomonas transparens]|uniref:Uncharacterized protein n=1 Tax=Marinomonas transparens TaxID=2795388 RepID=A0A934JVX9_9GAMM|nr:hypothetical protein [Marinomonas transparens]MBJ7539252.1 hypothetical protein [Marinomonas transparens]